MRLKPGMSEENRQAVQSFLDYATGCPGGIGRVFRQFCRQRPCETRLLVKVYDATHPGLNHLPARKLTPTRTKVRIALEDAWESGGAWPSWGRWITRHRPLFSVLIPVLILPMLLSPTHPIAVYRYLIDSYKASLVAEAAASTDTDLTLFLTSPAQVQRYRADLLEDMLDTRSSKLCVIVRYPDGSLRQESIRTWNGFLPEKLPRFLRNWLDRKELPYLGDEVDTWLRGNTIMAVTHYHAFGGAPSAGDSHAQRLSRVPEVIIVNGLVPMVYLNGRVVSYSDNVIVSKEVFRSMRLLELNLVMDINRGFSWSEEPGQVLTSFLGYLRDYRKVDIASRARIAKCVWEMCGEFEDEYRAVFPRGFDPNSYKDDADRFSILRNLGILNYWGHRLSFSSSGGVV